MPRNSPNRNYFRRVKDGRIGRNLQTQRARLGRLALGCESPTCRGLPKGPYYTTRTDAELDKLVRIRRIYEYNHKNVGASLAPRDASQPQPAEKKGKKNNPLRLSDAPPLVQDREITGKCELLCVGCHRLVTHKWRKPTWTIAEDEQVMVEQAPIFPDEARRAEIDKLYDDAHAKFEEAEVEFEPEIMDEDEYAARADPEDEEDSEDKGETEEEPETEDEETEQGDE